MGTKYAEKLKAGTIKLNEDHIAELEKIKARAMKNANLEMANKADAKIKQLQVENKKLDPTPELLGRYPANNAYKMTWHNGHRSSEHGNEIVCRFQRTSKLDAVKGTLILVIRTDASAMSNTPNDVVILDGSKGKEVGRIKGIGTNKTQRIPLTLSTADALEIAVVNYGNEAVRLKLFNDDIPELFLEVQQ